MEREVNSMHTDPVRINGSILEMIIRDERCQVILAEIRNDR